MPTKTQAIKAFLTEFTIADLAALYHYGMEVQVNVAQDNGEPIQQESGYTGRIWRGFSDGIQTWKPFRIPWNANTEPEYNEVIIKNGQERPKQLTWDLSKHAEGIGMTGWCWTERVSKWVAFDFDSIIGHSTVGITADELQKVQDEACKIPWVTVRKSTSGTGLHLYVFLNNIPTANHTEHAALARSILGKMTAATGYSFESKVDQCGGNIWVWHRKMCGTDGLTLIKKGSVLNDIPINWRDHVPVIQGKRKKNLPHYIGNNDQNLFEQITGQRPAVKLDEGHKKLLEYLDQINAQWWYDNDNHLLVCHSYDLKRAHEDLNFRGIFETIATGDSGARTGGDHNVFCFPEEIPEGAWVVRRFHPGEQEHQTWSQDASGWTKCYFNKEPTLETAARAYDGIETEKGEFIFNQAEVADAALKRLNTYLNLPSWACNRETIVKPHKDGRRLVVKVKRENTDDYGKMSGWREDKGYWVKIFNANIANPETSNSQNYDNVVRHLTSTTGEDSGWVIRAENQWHNEPLTHIKLALKSFGLSDVEINKALGACVMESWSLVNKPFQPEYPGNREWNRNTAQLRFPPQQEEPFKHPTWDRVLNHTGAGFDDAIKNHGWCVANGIQNGGDYLRLWIASLFQEPTEQLPYIFLYSPEEQTGKTTLHEALQLLITDTGYMKIDQAMISQGGFNGEMANAVLCAMDECDLRKNPQARNRMKSWTGAKTLLIHPKGKTPYVMTNIAHFIHTGNNPAECDIKTADTRVSFGRVYPLEPEEMIPKGVLYEQLKREAPAFLATILKLDIPPCDDRLNIPIINTIEKQIIAQSNRDELEIFLDEVAYYCPGKSIRYKDFFDRFISWLDPSDAINWTKIKTGKSLPSKYPKGRLSTDGSQYHVGNVSFIKPTDTELEEKKFILRGDNIVLED